MNRRVVVFLGFYSSIVLIFIAIFFSIYPWEKDIAKERLEYIEEIKWKAATLEMLADTISICTDTSFCADYFYKASRFELYKIEADTINFSSRINNPSSCLQNAIEFSKYAPLNRIWKNNKDSLYRFDYKAKAFWYAEAYVTKRKNDTTSYFTADTSILRITPRVYLKLNRISN